MRPLRITHVLARLLVATGLLQELDNEGYNLTDEIVALEEMQDNLAGEYPEEG